MFYLFLQVYKIKHPNTIIGIDISIDFKEVPELYIEFETVAVSSEFDVDVSGKVVDVKEGEIDSKLSVTANVKSEEAI